MKQKNCLAMAAAGLALALLGGCGGAPQEQKSAESAPKPVPVSVAVAKKTAIEDSESSVGTIAARTSPWVASEVGGQVQKVLVDVGSHVKAGDLMAEVDPEPYLLEIRRTEAEIRRVTALLDNASRVARRYEKLVAGNFVSQTQLDQVLSDEKALQQQLEGLKASLAIGRRNLSKTRVLAPVSGIVQERKVSVGDFVVGSPLPTQLFQIATSDILQVRLPFPEVMAQKFQVGQKARLVSPALPEMLVEGQVTDIQPMYSTASRAADVIVEVQNPGFLHPGTSVNGTVVTEVREAVVVPVTSVVERPAGDVVYVVEGGRVRERPVKVGLRQGGIVEILSGLNNQETVVTEGAYYLTDGALVLVQDKSSKPS